MDKAVKQATELAERFNDVTILYAAQEHGFPNAVPIMAALGIVSKYADESGSSLEEVLEKQLEGIRRKGAVHDE